MINFIESHSFSFNLKLGYFIFLLLFTIFLFYQNFNKINRNILSSNSNFTQSGPKPTMNLFSLIVGMTSLHLYFESRFEKWKNETKLTPEDITELAKVRQYKQELLNTQAMAEKDKITYLNKFNSIDHTATNLHLDNNSIQNTIKMVNLVNDLKVKKAQGNNLNSEELKALSQEKEIHQTLKNQQESFEKNITELRELTKNSSIIDLDFRANQ